MLTSGIHPGKFIADGREDELIDTIADNVMIVADAFYPKPVWYRTLDAPTDEFITLEGGENEPREHNPMLGWRGIRRELDQPEILKCEFKAIKKLHEKGYTNIGIMIPLSQSPSELVQAKALCSEIGLEPHKDVDFGMMVEIPAAAIMIDEYIKVGIDFVSLGTNDLTQYTLAVDRNNEFVAKHYREEHPAVMALIERIGFGQVEPNHLSAQRTGQIYAQLIADSNLNIIENGMFLTYDYENRKAVANASVPGEWLLVYNEEKLYDTLGKVIDHYKENNKIIFKYIFL